MASKKQKKKTTCKAITKATGGKCKIQALENGYCFRHQPVGKKGAIAPKKKVPKVKTPKTNNLLGDVNVQVFYVTKDRNKFIRVITSKILPSDD